MCKELLNKPDDRWLELRCFVCSMFQIDWKTHDYSSERYCSVCQLNTVNLRLVDWRPLPIRVFYFSSEILKVMIFKIPKLLLYSLLGSPEEWSRTINILKEKRKPEEGSLSLPNDENNL